jgi:hypothetical protein
VLFSIAGPLLSASVALLIFAGVGSESLSEAGGPMDAHQAEELV